MPLDGTGMPAPQDRPWIDGTGCRWLRALYAGGMDGITMQPHLAGHAGVCEIILDRPEVLNAINTAMAARLSQACAELAANPHVRAVVLSGAGARAFCVGADLKERNWACRSQWSPPCTGTPLAVAASSPCRAT